MNKYLTGLLALALLAGCSAAQSSAASFQQISQEEAMRIMEEETGYILLDVRTLDEYNESHIPGAVCIPNEHINTTPPSQLPDKSQTILVCCRSGNRSKQAAQKLADMGYTKVYEFGGMIAWSGEITTDAPETGEKKNAMIRTAEEMEQHAENGRNYNRKCWICHSNCLPVALQMKQVLKERFPHIDGEIRICDIGTIIASHCGPGTVAIFFYGDERPAMEQNQQKDGDSN